MINLIKEYLSLSGLITSIPIIIGIVLGFSKWLDDNFGKGSIAQQIPDYIEKLKINRPFSKFLISSVYLSDIVYGKKIISLRAFLTSALVTVLFFIALCIILTIRNPYSWLSIPDVTNLVWQRFAYLLIFGIFIDYISISLTRCIFNWSSQKNIIIQVFSVFIDFVFSMFLFAFLFVNFKHFIINKKLPNEGENVDYSLIDSIISWFSHPLELSGYFVTLEDWYIKPNGEIIGGNSELIYAFPEGMLFFSSLFTSIFGMVFLFAAILYKYTSIFDKFKNFLIAQLAQNMSDKPIHSATIILLGTVFAPFGILIILLELIYEILI
ncbi:hypothetical protein [Neisseria dentiae]|uniref:hypothetical protein n=1 Tax=Neisseria dentiae TaxID=194197 RepID=UPI00211B7CEA|nr:hypothetical protein [Neisseria dentiae]MCQ9326257.1 hypothetical protein [Neisseria dentiae]